MTLTTRSQRQRLVRGAIDLVANTALVPDDYERHLLNLFIDGELSIDQVIKLIKEFESTAEK